MVGRLTPPGEIAGIGSFPLSSQRLAEAEDGVDISVSVYDPMDNERLDGPAQCPGAWAKVTQGAECIKVVRAYVAQNDNSNADKNLY